MAIAGFKDKRLAELFNAGQSANINPDHHDKVLLVLDFLNAIGDTSDCFGHYGFHKLKGKRKEECAMEVSGNYRITFKWDGHDVYDLQYEDYH